MTLACCRWVCAAARALCHQPFLPFMPPPMLHLRYRPHHHRQLRYPSTKCSWSFVLSVQALAPCQCAREFRRGHRRSQASFYAHHSKVIIVEHFQFEVQLSFTLRGCTAGKIRHIGILFQQLQGDVVTMNPKKWLVSRYHGDCTNPSCMDS